MLVDRAVAVAAARVAQLLADAALEEALAALAAHHAVVTTCACAAANTSVNKCLLNELYTYVVSYSHTS